MGVLLSDRGKHDTGLTTDIVDIYIYIYIFMSGIEKCSIYIYIYIYIYIHTYNVFEHTRYSYFI